MMKTISSGNRSTVSLAKGPVRLFGFAGIVFGVLGLIVGGNSFALRVPHGAVGDGHLFGLLTNGWTDLLFVAAGLLLVFGSSAHWFAKASARLTALVLGAAAIVAVIRGNGVFGIFAANHWTEIIWGAAAVVLAVVAMAPRVGRRQTAKPVSHEAAADDPRDPREATDHELVTARH